MHARRQSLESIGFLTDTPSLASLEGDWTVMKKVAAESAGQGPLPRLAKAEADLESLRKELDHTHQLATLGTLTAGIAHEINNILTPVLAYAQMAAGNPEDAALQAKALNRTIAGVESASRIIEAVLGFARADEETRPANISRVIEASLACLSRAPERDGVTLTLEVDPDAAVSIRPLALQQVILNLVLNALAALQGNRGELRIIAAPEEDGTTQIRIADNGPGIPEKVASTLFEPFVTSRPRQDGSGRSAEPGGSGLGLAICKRPSRSRSPPPPRIATRRQPDRCRTHVVRVGTRGDPVFFAIAERSAAIVTVFSLSEGLCRRALSPG
ncbi:MAG: sensor histidine kinase [Planctomycetota bacterium]